MVIRNRYPAHFKDPKANQPEMMFQVSGMTKPDEGLAWFSDNVKCMFLSVNTILSNSLHLF